MGQLTVKNTNQVFETSAVVSILNTLLRNGVKIRHDCGGKALCGTCRITIISGEGGLSPKREREIQRLTAVGAAPNERLACQTYVTGSVTIEIPEGDFEKQ